MNVLVDVTNQPPVVEVNTPRRLGRQNARVVLPGPIPSWKDLILVLHRLRAMQCIIHLMSRLHVPQVSLAPSLRRHALYVKGVLTRRRLLLRIARCAQLVFIAWWDRQVFAGSNIYAFNIIVTYAVVVL